MRDVGTVKHKNEIVGGSSVKRDSWMLQRED